MQEIRDRSKRLKVLIPTKDVQSHRQRWCQRRLAYLLPHCADFALAYEGAGITAAQCADSCDSCHQYHIRWYWWQFLATGNHGVSDVVKENTPLWRSINSWWPTTASHNTVWERGLSKFARCFANFANHSVSVAGAQPQGWWCRGSGPNFRTDPLKFLHFFAGGSHQEGL